MSEPKLPLSFKVRCSGAMHRMTLTERGDLLLHDHPELAGDEVMAVLSGGKCRCLDVRDRWYDFARERKAAKRSGVVAVPDKLPAALTRYGGVMTDKLRARYERRKADREYAHLYATPLSCGLRPDVKLIGCGNARKAERKQFIKLTFQKRFWLRCEEIASEINDKLGYQTPASHSWGNPVVATPRNWMSGGVRPTFHSYDTPVYCENKPHAIVSIERALRWHTQPLLMLRAYLKCHCMLRDEHGRVIATSALARSIDGQPAGHELFFAARQEDDLTIEGCWCYAQQSSSGLWEVTKWLPQPPRNVIYHSLYGDEEEAELDTSEPVIV